MKYCVVVFLFIAKTCIGQQWQAEVMAGASFYKGDLTQSSLPFRTIKPAVSINLKYDMYALVLRGGISWAQAEGNDKYNRQADLKARNFSFKTNILEANICAEYNLLEPDLFDAYPYIFAGIGVFHFNPYTYDNSNQKTYLQPLGTEGQGIPGLNRKKYSLTQFCLPFGAGWKYKVNEKIQLAYELGVRRLFTDYFDDVSKTYVGLETLLSNNGAKAVELSYRKNAPFSEEGEVRGNSGAKDFYIFNGIKLTINIGKNP